MPKHSIRQPPLRLLYLPSLHVHLKLVLRQSVPGVRDLLGGGLELVLVVDSFLEEVQHRKPVSVVVELELLHDRLGRLRELVHEQLQQGKHRAHGVRFDRGRSVG